MSTQTQEPVEQGTKPIKEHEWLNNLVGDWLVETEMNMGPDKPKQWAEGRETIKNFGGLWAFGEGSATMPGGAPMTYYAALGYDVTYKEYRSCWIASVSSHLWTKSGQLSADGKTLTLEGLGPDMMGDAESVAYRDVFELVDDNHFNMTHYGQTNGQWEVFMKAHYTRK